MPDRPLRVIARVIAKPDDVNHVRTILVTLVEATRKEPGCLSYQLLQNQSEPTDFTFIEEWASVAAEQAHFTTAHVSDAIRRLTGLLAIEPDIRRYIVVQ
ncbi:MAG: antibiotic biosynthesis monooxygenase [Nitrospira sp.]|nr:antibiotic biosynthesis monooxygenase [Nitrospira sp.]